MHGRRPGRDSTATRIWRPAVFRSGWLDHVHRIADRLEQSRLISIAVVEGFALAGGLELALACDLIVTADDARIGDRHLNFDLIPGGGASQRLPRAIGPQRAKLLLYTAQWISGLEAAAWGLAARSVPRRHSMRPSRNSSV